MADSSENLATDVPTTETTAQLNAAISSALDAYLNAYVQLGRFSGAVRLTCEDGTAFTRGYGFANREHEVANDLQTKFRIGSVTKQFTAVAILQLQAQGLLEDSNRRFRPICLTTLRAIASLFIIF